MDDEAPAELVDVELPLVVAVVGSGAVTGADPAELSTVAAVADVIEVDVSSSPLAQATPTTARAANTDVNTASIFLNISHLLNDLR